MSTRRCTLLCFIVLTFMAATGAFASAGISEFLAARLESDAGPHRVWVFFTDHGESAPAQLRAMIDGTPVPQAARRRRLSRLGSARPDIHDLPVNAAYVRVLRDRGLRVRGASRYLNAASVVGTAPQIRPIARLPFVARIDAVRSFRRPRPEVGAKIGPSPRPRGFPAPGAAPDPADYGESWTQSDLVGVPALHDDGLDGQGVLIAVLDTGFDRTHTALDHLDVVAEWDFVNGDPVTANELGDPADQHNHGTSILGALAGYTPGELIGPAWNAQFALAKTEQIDVEIQAEEDDYVFALEWADTLGAAVVNGSLGYNDWYTYSDIDGNTAVTTRAADIAAAHGIAVVVAAGNEGPLPWPGLNAPADGDSVITVGAVDTTLAVASFSSRGPTFDGRIKPDVSAPGVSVFTVDPSGTDSYTRVTGTSLAAPLVAGAVALILQKHPQFGPMDVLAALRNTASHAGAPNNDIGWGVIAAAAAALDIASAVGDTPTRVRAGAILFNNRPNPFTARGGTVIRFTIERNADGRVTAEGQPVILAVYDATGRPVRTLFGGIPPGNDAAVRWDGRDDRGSPVSAGVYFSVLRIGGQTVAKKMVMLR